MWIHGLIILGATLGIWFFSELLSKGNSSLGDKLGISPSVKGATMDAVASSFPEFCTVIFALQAGAFEAGVGVICGSALYNILVIPAISALIVKELKIQQDVVKRDGFIYLLVVVGLFLIIWLGSSGDKDGMEHHWISMWVGFGAILAYVAYVILLVVQAKKSSQSSQSEESSEGESDDFNVIKVVVFITIGMAGIGLATHFLVESSLHLFREWGFSMAIAGVTILAAATSLPDTLLSVFSVRKGDADAAISNAFGSNTFDILICLGVPILFTGGVWVNWGDSWAILLFLLASTVVSLAFLCTQLILTKLEATILIAIYVVFIVLAFLGYLTQGVA